jgi:large subunit ribosomal protein L19
MKSIEQAAKIIHTDVLVKKVPTFKVGQTVKVYQRIKEGEKERTQMFEGMVIAVGSGSGTQKTFTVRKVVDGVGVEKVFPIYGATLEKVVIKKEARVRRAKLYFLRTAVGKAARLKETMVKEESSAKEEEAEKVE